MRILNFKLSRVEPEKSFVISGPDNPEKTTDIGESNCPCRGNLKFSQGDVGKFDPD